MGPLVKILCPFVIIIALLSSSSSSSPHCSMICKRSSASRGRLYRGFFAPVSHFRLPSPGLDDACLLPYPGSAYGRLQQSFERVCFSEWYSASSWPSRPSTTSCSLRSSLSSSSPSSAFSSSRSVHENTGPENEGPNHLAENCRTEKCSTGRCKIRKRRSLPPRSYLNAPLIGQ